jgi:carbonic anhydrase
MSDILKEVLEANDRYAAEFGEKSKLAMPPARRFAILTCMDARLDPAKYAGLAEGDAHVIRNAGGRASDDAIRSLVISYKLLGTREWFVIHHTNCGMEFFTNDVIRGLLANSLETAALTAEGFKDVGQGPGSHAGDFIEWLTIRDQAASVLADVERIKSHPLVPSGIPVYGYIYDVGSGKLIEVPEATKAGCRKLNVRALSEVRSWTGRRVPRRLEFKGASAPNYSKLPFHVPRSIRKSTANRCW